MSDTTPSGLSDNGASALAYVTIVPAIVFLVLPPYNARPIVRFHSWQSIFFNVAAVALYVVLVILGRIPILGFFAWILILLAQLGLFILWIVVVIKALNGQRFSIPIIGPLAEGQANK